jgi:hypothetical protein
MVMKPNIEFHIEELYLTGFPYCDRYRIAEALQLEMTRLLTAKGTHSSLSRNKELIRIDAGKFEVGHSGKPERIGSKTARAVHDVLIK